MSELFEITFEIKTQCEVEIRQKVQWNWLKVLKEKQLKKEVMYKA